MLDINVNILYTHITIPVQLNWLMHWSLCRWHSIEKLLLAWVLSPYFGGLRWWRFEHKLTLSSLAQWIPSYGSAVCISTLAKPCGLSWLPRTLGDCFSLCFDLVVDGSWWKGIKCPLEFTIWWSWQEVQSQQPGGRAGITRPVLTPLSFDGGEWVHHRAGDKLPLSALIPAEQVENRRKASLSTA